MKARLLLAAVSGVVGVFAFPPFGLWPLAILAVAGLSIAVNKQRSKHAALLGFVFGAGLFGPMLHWTATYVGALPWLVLTFAMIWFTTLLAAALPVLQRQRFGPVFVAGGWVAEEALRDRVPFGGFPWGRWAFSQAESPLKWFATLGGAPLVTFVVALAGACLAAAVYRPGVIRSSLRVTIAVLLVISGAALGVPLKPPASSHTTTIAAIQGNVPDRGLEFNARRRQVLDNHVAETLKLVADIKAGRMPKPSLVLWPENASDIDPTTNPDAAQVIQQATDAVGVPILVGALLDGPGPNHVTNAGIVWMPSSSPNPGPGQRYVKRHPVPFGEYIPLRSIAEKVSSKVNLVGRDMVAGKGNGLLTQTPYPVGDVICFEVAYDGLVRSSVRAGAQLLVIQTNNATFGHSAETYQQLAMAQLRAVENRRTVVQVATSGKSAIIGPDGTIEQESGALFTSAVLTRTVALETSTTLATRTEAVTEWVLVALGLLGIALGAAPAVRRRWFGTADPATARTSGTPATEPSGSADREPEQPAGTTAEK
ncbi:MAG TPA: apolipoprotein N-acyltransferase [Jatrophihabitans sp.]|jgi:apolipoprotein N-acyltransferase